MIRWFFLSAVQGGLALAGTFGLGLAMLGFYTRAPTLGFGAGLFVMSAVLFVVTGGMREV